MNFMMEVKSASMEIPQEVQIHESESCGLYYSIMSNSQNNFKK